MSIDVINYILDLILGTLIGLPIIGCFLSLLLGLIYYLIYPSRTKRALNLVVVGISFSITALIFILVLLSPILIISYFINK
jgi:hypothetical protein